MRSNSSAEAALHVVLLLALLPRGGELSSTDLARFHDLSPATLAKVLQQLAAAGVVSASTGRHGGYRLARAANLINAYDVVSALDGVEPVFICREIRRAGPCAGRRDKYSPRCAVARAMDGATLAWRDSLKTVSIAALVSTTQNEVSQDIGRKAEHWLAAHAR